MLAGILFCGYGQPVFHGKRMDIVILNLYERRAMVAAHRHRHGTPLGIVYLPDALNGIIQSVAEQGVPAS